MILAASDFTFKGLDLVWVILCNCSSAGTDFKMYHLLESHATPS